MALKGEGVVRVDALEAEPGGGDDRGLAQVDDESLEAGRSKCKVNRVFRAAVASLNLVPFSRDHLK